MVLVHMQKFIDQKVFSLIVWLIRLWREKSIPEPKLPENPKILFIKKSIVGDSIYALPAMEAFHKHLNANVDVLCDKSNKIVFEDQPFVNKIHMFTVSSIWKLRRKYDLVVDTEPWTNASALVAWFTGKSSIGFNNQMRSKMYTYTICYDKTQHIVETYFNFFTYFSNRNLTIRLIDMKIKKNDEQSVLKKLNETKKLIGLAPGVSGKATSRLWITSRWAQVAKIINNQFPEYTVVLFGTHHDVEIGRVIENSAKVLNLMGKTNLGEAIAATKSCSVFIGLDSGPVHMAACMGVPTIGLYGPNTPIIWGPYGKNNISLYHKNPGIPTIDNTYAGYERPSHYERKAMQDITVDEVVNAVRTLLQKSKTA